MVTWVFGYLGRFDQFHNYAPKYPYYSPSAPNLWPRGNMPGNTNPLLAMLRQTRTPIRPRKGPDAVLVRVQRMVRHFPGLSGSRSIPRDRISSSIRARCSWASGLSSTTSRG